MGSTGSVRRSLLRSRRDGKPNKRTVSALCRSPQHALALEQSTASVPERVCLRAGRQLTPLGAGEYNAGTGGSEHDPLTPAQDRGCRESQCAARLGVIVQCASRRTGVRSSVASAALLRGKPVAPDSDGPFFDNQSKMMGREQRKSVSERVLAGLAPACDCVHRHPKELRLTPGEKWQLASSLSWSDRVSSDQFQLRRALWKRSQRRRVPCPQAAGQA